MASQKFHKAYAESVHLEGQLSKLAHKDTAIHKLEDEGKKTAKKECLSRVSISLPCAKLLILGARSTCEVTVD
jgi:hypothetical protein